MTSLVYRLTYAISLLPISLLEDVRQGILVLNGYKVDNLILWNAKLAELEQLELDSNEFEIYI